MTTGDFRPQPGPYGEPGEDPPPGGQEPGGLGLRFAARLIDGIFVIIVAFFLAFVTDSLSNYWVTGLFTGLLMLLLRGFRGTQGWTPGKKLLGLSVHGPAARRSRTSSSRRSATPSRCSPSSRSSAACWVIAMIVIAVTINGSPTKQGKHDELAGGTQVVKG